MLLIQSCGFSVCLSIFFCLLICFLEYLRFSDSLSVFVCNCANIKIYLKALRYITVEVYTEMDFINFH